MTYLQNDAVSILTGEILALAGTELTQELTDILEENWVSCETCLQYRSQSEAGHTVTYPSCPVVLTDLGLELD